MTLFDIAYRCCMLDKYGICNDGARSGVSVAQWCDVRFVMRTQIFFFVPRSRQDEWISSFTTFQTVLFLNILGLPHRVVGLLVNKKELSARVAFSLCDRMKALLIPFEGF